MSSGIYLIRNLINNKKYVGKSINIEQRWREHKKPRSGCIYIRNAIQKYGIENFEFTIIEFFNSETPHLRDILSIREDYWINHLDTFANHGKGYNLTCNGKEGMEVSSKTREKMSASQKRVIHTPEWNKNVSKALIGKKNPKISYAQKGVPCHNRGKPMIGRKRNLKEVKPVKATNLATGEELLFSRMYECSLYFIGNRNDTYYLRKIIKGYIPKYKGKWQHLLNEWKFEYQTTAPLLKIQRN
jgi:group I intron endonuclease